MASRNVSTSPSSSPAESSNVRSTSSRDNSSEPPRKRARSEITSEQRKEARAHRNRIAAQNSRDKRKAYFTHLESRVGELEEENRRLRASMGLSQLAESEEQKDAFLKRESSIERENEELKERIKTLENGWNAIVQALQASGLPFNIPFAPAATTAVTQPTLSPSNSTSPQPPTSTFPVFVPRSPVLPISPAPSHSSLSSSTSVFDEFEATRHLARVATIEDAQLTSMSLQRVASQRLKFMTNSNPLALRRRLSTTTRFHFRPMKWPWRISYMRSLLLSRPHRVSKSPLTWRRPILPFRRRR